MPTVAPALVGVPIISENAPPLLVFRKNKNAAWHTHAVVVCFHQQPAHPINLEDAVANSGYGTDITNQQSGNYAYDPIGNMVHDEQGKINTVSWTVYGKIDHLPPMLVFKI